MARHLLDRLLSAAALLLLVPVMGLVALGVRLSSTGPILYRARRAGLKGEEFDLYKFRTMHVRSAPDSAITAYRDPRIFPFGRWLRVSKLDELPQLFNILRGEMAIVGPRPEDARIVRDYYTARQRETLAVLPGLTSPGTLSYYFHDEQLPSPDDAERIYVEQVLPAKLELDRQYVVKRSLLGDWLIIMRTAALIAAAVLRRGAGRAVTSPSRPASTSPR